MIRRYDIALVLDLNDGISPVITPDDARKVVTVLRAHGVTVTGAE